MEASPLSGAEGGRGVKEAPVACEVAKASASAREAAWRDSMARFIAVFMPSNKILEAVGGLQFGRKLHNATAGARGFSRSQACLLPQEFAGCLSYF